MSLLFARRSLLAPLALGGALLLAAACSPASTATPTTAPAMTATPTRIPTATAGIPVTPPPTAAPTSTPAPPPTGTPTPRATPTPAATATLVATSAPTRPSAKSGGVLKLVQPGDPVSCDLELFRGRDYRSVHTCNPMFNQLVRLHPFDHGRILPDLATEWGADAAGTTWTFRLRGDVKWHDGVAFTARDVVYSYNRVLSPPQGIQVGRADTLTQYVESVSAPDDRTLVVKTKFPAASFLLNAASVYASIYPEHLLATRTPPAMEDFATVVGTGPFVQNGATKGSVFKLKRNTGYFDAPRPYLDEVWWVNMPNPATQLAALKAGEIDGIPVGITDVQTADLDRDYKGKVNVVTVATANVVAVTMNSKVAPFDNPDVRRAVNLAFDRQDAVASQGGGALGASMPPSGSWGLPKEALAALPGLGDKAKEREQAKALLAKAGAAATVKVKMQTRAEPYFQNIAAMAQAQLASVGIAAEIENLESNAYLDRMGKRDFQLTASNTGGFLDDPDAVFATGYLCKSPENAAGVCDPAIDTMFAQQQRELDPAKRRVLVQDMQRRVWDQDGSIVLLWSLRRSPLAASVKDFVMGASNYQGMRLDQVWLDR